MRFSKVRNCPCPVTRELLAAFVHDSYQQPGHYLIGWITPEPATEIDPLHAAVIKLSMTRSFGVVETYPPGWTFEVSFRRQLRIGDRLQAVFVDRRDLQSLPTDTQRKLFEYAEGQS